LNQPLTAILSNAQAAQDLLALDVLDLEAVREILSDIVADDKRAAAVIRRLRTLLKKGDLEFVPLDVNEIVGEVAWLVKNDALIRNVSMSLDLASDLPGVLGDRVQLQQVVLNLVLNGLEALRPPGAGARTLVIRTARDGASAVTVAVQDSGTGIDEKDADRIFQPLYTTKAEGLHGPDHCANHRGRARRPVGGREQPTWWGDRLFHVADEEERRMLTAVAPLVFIVDDNLSVRKSLSRLLALAGYTVEAFESAREFL